MIGKGFKFDVQVECASRSLQTTNVSDRGLFKSYDPLNTLGAPVIALEWLNLKSSYFYSGTISILATR